LRPELLLIPGLRSLSPWFRHSETPPQAELAAALEWYATIQPSLASRFLDEYEGLIERLRENPGQFPSVEQKKNMYTVSRFRYASADLICVKDE